ncbi:selenocysteine-specific elongation factor [Paracoccus isoporae]|uniref:Selenocysteine-specific elongation factor n=1 Tax=Paracoccus isoporae TaxID=591205 RepID=A0A1G6XP31_9RHOB|nr:selenocysteine-specific translation elongation factor [Paracoccus isoporae]SDD79782.1 selenocysteine-specific elongation factor [Paracoccus isoporae]
MIIGTAGHIDHGKTALVHALTGVDADRLAEEKRRGITIDLGFAYQDLGDGQVTGFVDMPGHERLIHNMIAGAGGIDAALIVIAADDGIMPQTREHLEILTLLDLRHAVVAISKADLADDARIESLRAEIGAVLAPTPMRDAEVIPVSARTGHGVESLRAALRELSAGLAPRKRTGRPRLIVDRAFTLDGAGTVVTGMMLSGTLSVGDEVALSPSGLRARVRGIRAQNRKAEQAAAGTRVALNLSGIGRDEIGRGDVVVAPDADAPTDRVDAALRWVGAKPFNSGSRGHLHTGAASAEARIVSLGGELDGAHLVQIVLDRPLALGWGDRFILRDASARTTLGGGRFLDLRPPARRRATPERRAALRAAAQSDPVRALNGLLAAPPHIVDLDAFLRDRALAPQDLDLAQWVVLGQAPRLLMTPARRADLLRQAGEVLTAFHAENPDLQGMSREALRLSLTPRLPKPGFAALLREAADQRLVALAGGFVRHEDHAPRMAAADEEIFASLAPMLAGDVRFRPPRVRDLAAELGEEAAEIRRVLKLAARLGRVDQLAHDHFFLRGTTAEMAAMLRDLSAAAPDGWFTAAQFRDLTQNGRKVAIQILDFFDRVGLTLRRGDLRRINPHRAELY